MEKMRLIKKYDEVIAIDAVTLRKIGRIINESTGRCIENPDRESPEMFARVFGGHRDIYHQCDNAPNPFFVKSWAQVFENPEMLPSGTENIFIEH